MSVEEITALVSNAVAAAMAQQKTNMPDVDTPTAGPSDPRPVPTATKQRTKQQRQGAVEAGSLAWDATTGEWVIRFKHPSRFVNTRNGTGRIALDLATAAIPSSDKGKNWVAFFNLWEGPPRTK